MIDNGAIHIRSNDKLPEPWPPLHRAESVVESSRRGEEEGCMRFIIPRFKYLAALIFNRNLLCHRQVATSCKVPIRDVMSALVQPRY